MTLKVFLNMQGSHRYPAVLIAFGLVFCYNAVLLSELPCICWVCMKVTRSLIDNTPSILQIFSFVLRCHQPSDLSLKTFSSYTKIQILLIIKVFSQVNGAEKDTITWKCLIFYIHEIFGAIIKPKAICECKSISI